MFTFETDLTLDSIMVGKESTRSDEMIKDREVLKVVNNSLFVGREFESIGYPKDEEMDVGSLAMYFGEDHSFRTKMYVEYTEFEDGAGVCERCGVHINIFNQSPYSVCKDCNQELEKTNEIIL